VVTACETGTVAVGVAVGTIGVVMTAVAVMVGVTVGFVVEMNCAAT
jgi:hypothetical protein